MTPVIIRLSERLRKQIENYLNECLPDEACGLLGGHDGNAEVMLPVRNDLQSATRFRMNASEQIQAILWLEAQCLDMIGIFHSHPRGPETPSEMDLQEHAYPECAAIICSNPNEDWVIRAFSIQEGRALEIELVFH